METEKKNDSEKKTANNKANIGTETKNKNESNYIKKVKEKI
jgi:hypothetical protein